MKGRQILCGRTWLLLMAQPLKHRQSDSTGHIIVNANSAFHPSGVGKWVPASAGKTGRYMVYSVSGWTRGVQVKLWDPLRTRAIPEHLRGVFTTRRYTNLRLPLPLPYLRNCMWLTLTNHSRPSSFVDATICNVYFCADSAEFATQISAENSHSTSRR